MIECVHCHDDKFYVVYGPSNMILICIWCGTNMVYSVSTDKSGNPSIHLEEL